MERIQRAKEHKRKALVGSLRCSSPTKRKSKVPGFLGLKHQFLKSPTAQMTEDGSVPASSISPRKLAEARRKLGSKVFGISPTKGLSLMSTASRRRTMAAKAKGSVPEAAHPAEADFEQSSNSSLKSDSSISSSHRSPEEHHEHRETALETNADYAIIKPMGLATEVEARPKRSPLQQNAPEPQNNGLKKGDIFRRAPKKRLFSGHSVTTAEKKLQSSIKERIEFLKVKYETPNHP